MLVGIQAEREALWQLRASADEVIDTTLLSVHQLRRMLLERWGGDARGSGMTVRLISFGFRYGVPVDADLVLDVRFLPNPYFVEELKPLAGTDAAVSGFVMGHEDSQHFLERCTDFLAFLIPRYGREGKSYLTVALGCTGGRHRSVALVEALSSALADLPQAVHVTHRDKLRSRAKPMEHQEVSP